TSFPKEEKKHEDSMLSFDYLIPSGFIGLNVYRENRIHVVSTDIEILSDKLTSNADESENEFFILIKKIKPELVAYLKRDTHRLWNTSDELNEWLVFLGIGPRYRGVEYSIKKIERITLKNNIPAVLIEAVTLYTFKPSYRFIVGMTPSGKVFKISNKSRPPASEEEYFSTAFIQSVSRITRPSAKRDKLSDCAFEKLLETLEFKNVGSKL
ncbi:MAG: hypothetical protein U9Q34_02515, partial [Elusimicrobiota bacterium]|nr:hypothetical protein [Elusimicrobiota bacterium]